MQKQMQQQQSEMSVYDALRPPLELQANIQTHIAELQSGIVGFWDDQRKKEIRSQVRRMKKMIEDILEFEEHLPDAIVGMRKTVAEAELGLKDKVPLPLEELDADTEASYDTAA